MRVSRHARTEVCQYQGMTVRHQYADALSGQRGDLDFRGHPGEDFPNKGLKSLGVNVSGR